MTISIYLSAIRKNIPYDHHESDLYLKDCQETRELIALYGKEKESKPFRSALDNTMWVDIPFAFDPFWDKIQDREKRLVSFINLVIDFSESDPAGHMIYLNGQAKNALRDFAGMK